MRSGRAAFLLCLLPLLLPVCAHSGCTVGTTGVSFGSYQPLLSTPLDSAGTIIVSCTATSPVTVSVGSSSGRFNPRSLQSGALSDRLFYNLFIDGGRTIVWGDGTEGTSTIGGVAAAGVPSMLAVYGRIPPGQNVAVGQYGETLIVTISY